MIGSMLRDGVRGAVTQESAKDEQKQDACTVPEKRLPNCYLYTEREREREMPNCFLYRERERERELRTLNFITPGITILRSCLLFQSNVLSNLHAQRERT